MIGAVTDSTGAVLPGVTVLAVHEDTGNQFETVTDQRGTSRIPVRVGTYRISADLPGFTRIERTAVQLLVGQTVTVNMPNGIWQVGRGFQVSGMYFYGSGERLATIYGEDLRGVGEGFEAFAQRVRPDGSLVRRNGFVGDPVHRVDVRLQERIPIAGRVAIDGIVEVFNVFDRANFGSDVTDELSPLYGQAQFIPISRSRHGRCSWDSG